MSVKNELPQFPHLMRGLGVILIFLVVAPPVQVCVAGFMNHAWIGGGQLSDEIVHVFQSSVLPGVRAGYSIYMPPALVGGLLNAVGPARGAGLTPGGVVNRMIIAGGVFEGIYQAVVMASGGPFMAGNILIGLAQWIFSGLLCWIAATGFGLDKPVEP